MKSLSEYHIVLIYIMAHKYMHSSRICHAQSSVQYIRAAAMPTQAWAKLHTQFVRRNFVIYEHHLCMAPTLTKIYAACEQSALFVMVYS